jgi:hypothetical protein
MYFLIMAHSSKHWCVSYVRTAILIFVSDGEDEPLSQSKVFNRNSSQQEYRLRGWDVTDTFVTSEPKTVPFELT